MGLRIARFLLSLVVYALLHTGAFAVNPQDITKDLEQDLESVLPEAEDIQIPTLGSAEYGALETNQTQLSVKNFNVIYAAPPPAKLQQMVADTLSQYNGQTLTLQQVVKISREVEQKVVQFGYPLIRVILPAQKFTAVDAVVKLNVVSGHIENILIDFPDSDDVKDSVKADIKAFIINGWDEIKSDKYLHSEDLNRSLLTLKSHYGVEPKLFVSAGKALGGFNLNVSVKYNPMVNFVSFKNNLGPGFNRYAAQYVGMFNWVQPQYSQQVRIASIFSLQQTDEVYYRMVKLDYNRKWVNGVEFGAYTSLNRTASVAAENAKSKGNNDSYGISYTTPVTTKFNSNFTMRFNFDVIRDASYNINTEQFQYQDRLTTAGITALYDKKVGNIAHDVMISYKFGMDIFGAKAGTEGNTPPSKANAITNNPIFEASYNYKKSYAEFLHHVKVNGQYSNEQSVLSSQKFSLMGGDKVAGFVGDGMSADSGLTVNTGFTFKTVKVGERGYSPTLDVAYASGRVYNATAVENANPRARSIKLGISTNIGENKWEVGYAKARKHTTKWEDDEHISLNVLRLF